MKITQDVREYAATLGMESTYAIEAGMARKFGEFRERGGEVYRPVDTAVEADVEETARRIDRRDGCIEHGGSTGRCSPRRAL